ncbi:DUF1534 domain-containing protein [Pseudomonas congelans]|nr:DUF1534 domain-containing protein [Pseudomonas congelans]
MARQSFQSMGTVGVLRHLPFRTLQRGNAFRDALRQLLPHGISRSSSGSHCHPPPQY